MKKTLLIWILAVAAVVILVVAVVLFPHIVGIWQWNRVAAELRARGEKLTLDQFHKEILPPGENYFEMPYFAEVDGFQKKPGSRAEKLRDSLKEDRPRLRKLVLSWPSRLGSEVDFSVLSGNANASKEEKEADGLRSLKDRIAPFEPIREEALRYANRQKGSSKQTDPMFPDAILSASLSLMELLELHCRVALREGRGDEARQDILALAGMAKAVTTNETGSTFTLSGRAVLGMARSLIWQGMKKWRSEDLREFQITLSNSPAGLANVAQALRFDRALFNSTLDQIDKSGSGVASPFEESPPFPWQNSSFTLLSQANYNLTMQKWIDACDSNIRDPAYYEELEKSMKDRKGLDRFATAYNAMLDSVPHEIRSAMRYQDENELTRIAIALELYAREKGVLPGELQELVPEYIPAMPTPFISGQTFQYRQTGPDRYRIWSFGWDGMDDGGTRAKWTEEKGDWALSSEL